MGLRVVTFKIEEDFLEKIDWLVERLGVNRSDLIRAALETYMKLYGLNNSGDERKSFSY